MKKSPMSGGAAWINFILGGGILAAMGGAAYYQILKERERLAPKSIGTAQIGGEWELTDMHGKRRKSAEFLGKYTLVYFGFTYCPDICPNELTKITKLINMIEKKFGKGKVNVLFLSIDPERDSPAQLKEYLKSNEFHPDILGLSGTAEETKAFSKAYRVYFSKSPAADSNSQDYLVDHSTVLYLMDPKGEYVKFFGRISEAEDIFAFTAPLL